MHLLLGITGDNNAVMLLIGQGNDGRRAAVVKQDGVCHLPDLPEYPQGEVFAQYRVAFSSTYGTIVRYGIRISPVPCLGKAKLLLRNAQGQCRKSA